MTAPAAPFSSESVPVSPASVPFSPWSLGAYRRPRLAVLRIDPRSPDTLATDVNVSED